MTNPSGLKLVAIIVAVLVAGVLVAGVFLVPFRSTRASMGYDQSRLHWNTKNSTRFDGANINEVAELISQAVYPATQPENTPNNIILYTPEDWQAGLLAVSLLRPLDAVLLPASGNIVDEIQRLTAVSNVNIIRLNDVALSGDFETESLNTRDILELRGEVGNPPENAIIVNPNDPGTALLAAPWAAFSGDIIVFDAANAPEGIPRYTLGNVEAEDAKKIGSGNPAHTSVAFAMYEDPENPLFGWGFNAESLSGYRAYTLARSDMPAMALLSANLTRRGKPGPLLWTEEQSLPQVVNNYVWSQRAAFWVTPAEGPFHHFWILGNTTIITFPAQSQADYAVEIGPYRGKGAGLSGIEVLGAAWVVIGFASALWIALHQAKFLPLQNWIMRLAWPLFAMLVGPFGIPMYYFAHSRPEIRHGNMLLWDRPLWLQGMVATVSAVGFGASLMIATGYIATTLGLPLFPNQSALFWLGAPMVLVMIINYVVAVLISWPLFQTPMIGMFYDIPYREALPKALPMVGISMLAAAMGMNPAMWFFMMWNIPMMPTEESILWFGVMFFTAFLAFLVAWPLNYVFVRWQCKAGLM